MKIEHWKLDRIKPYGRNAKLHKDDLIQYSLAEFKPDQPIVVDTTGTIIKGHGRWKAAKALGLETFPVIVRDDLTKEQVRLARIADNKSSEGGWDEDLLMQEIEELEKDLPDFDFGNIGIDIDFNIIDDNKKEKINRIKNSEEINKKWNVKKGDLYSIGNNRLLCGDSTNNNDLFTLMNGEKADIILNDPPYDNIFLNFDNIVSDNSHIFTFLPDRLMIDYLKTSTYNFKGFFIFYHPSCAIPTERGEEYYLRHILISHETKNNPKGYIKGCGISSVIVDKYRRDEYHKHAKEIDLIKSLLSSYDFNLCFDGFAGTGSTMLACFNFGKKCYSIEKNESYCSVILEKFSNIGINIKKENRNENKNY